MTEHFINVQVARQTRAILQRVFTVLRVAENALSHHSDPQSKAAIAALARAERELGIADAHLRRYVPDHVLFARHETWFARMCRLWMRKT